VHLSGFLCIISSLLSFSTLSPPPPTYPVPPLLCRKAICLRKSRETPLGSSWPMERVLRVPLSTHTHPQAVRICPQTHLDT